MKHDGLEAPVSALGVAQGAELAFLDDANVTPDRRRSERDGPTRRSGPRLELDAAVRLRGASQGTVDARIFNLSAGGRGLALKSGMLRAGDLVTIKAGIAFDRPFYPALSDAIIAIHKDRAARTAS